MSIPLDRLYHYIESVAQDVYGDTVIYHFYPHGSKKFENLINLQEYDPVKRMTSPEIICHDQEPLDFEAYQHVKPYWSPIYQPLVDSLNLPSRNLKYRLSNVYDRCILLHSEKNSIEVSKYQCNNFVPVYYWSHALIALDWFRYAEHIAQNKLVKKQFLVYNRAWAGTREYRLKFADLLIDYQLVDQCQTSVGLTDQEVYYRNHQFINPTWKPTHQLEHSFNGNFTTSCYSADFDIGDYESTDIEVVLETLFDDRRLHLTEKSLRPIALGQPFILAGTPNSLEYLKSYGFKTFNSVFSEDYDTIEDPLERLTAIVHLMKSISNWTVYKRIANMEKLRLIAQYNKQHFFSQDFVEQITSELKTNLTAGLSEIEETNTSSKYIELRKKYLSMPEFRVLQKEVIKELGSTNIIQTLKAARKYYNKHLNK